MIGALRAGSCALPDCRCGVRPKPTSTRSWPSTVPLRPAGTTPPTLSPGSTRPGNRIAAGTTNGSGAGTGTGSSGGTAPPRGWASAGSSPWNASRTPPTRFNGRLLVHGPPAEAVEGNRPGSMGLIEFPGPAEARAWYASPVSADPAASDRPHRRGRRAGRGRRCRVRPASPCAEAQARDERAPRPAEEAEELAAGTPPPGCPCRAGLFPEDF
ncbi:DUF1330 domain-containing protein [Streptomyces massasporeus]|uniref:DUF1330 domain-containing protein n=1 Tax=Streptomyces massasporeus TaxID=67324 RepID=UPI003816880E